MLSFFSLTPYPSHLIPPTKTKEKSKSARIHGPFRILNIMTKLKRVYCYLDWLGLVHQALHIGLNWQYHADVDYRKGITATSRTADEPAQANKEWISTYSQLLSIHNIIMTSVGMQTFFKPDRVKKKKKKKKHKKRKT